jgi:heat shock protein 1/8
MIGGSSKLPKVRSTVSEFFGGKKLSHSVDPDEAVAHGAAVQAALIVRATDEDVSKFL